MNDARLSERYPSGIRVAYRVDGKGSPGKLINLSPNGGFVAASTFPPVGTRVQLAVVLEEGEQPIWLDLRVTWVSPEPKGNIPVPGFGGKWLHACSRVSEEHLDDFITGILGLDDAEIQEKDTGGDRKMYLFEFTGLVRPKPSAEESQTQGFTAPKTHDNLPAMAHLDAEEDGDAADSESSPEKESTKSEGGGRLGALFRKLSGIRMRGRSAAPAEPVEVDFTGHNHMVTYKLGKQTFSAEVLRAGTTWVVMTTDGDVPELWSRINIHLPLGDGKKAGFIEIQATLTRVKRTESQLSRTQVLQDESPEVFQTLYCKVNRLDEKGHVSAYKQFVESFGSQE